jgi:hypothetical protein
VLASWEAREREQGETAGSTPTFTLAVDDLPDDLELSGGCFFLARCRRGPVGEWEGERKQMRERGGFQRAPVVHIQRGWAWSMVVSIEHDWMARAALGTAS